MKKYKKLINILLVLLTNTIFNYHIPVCSDAFNEIEKNKLIATFYSNSLLFYNKNTKKMKISQTNDIKTIIQMLSDNQHKKYYIFDKVIGQSNAILYWKSNIQCVYGRIITKSAKNIFDKHSIKYEAEKIIDDKLLNKNNTIAIADKKIENTNNYNEAYKILLNEYK